MDSYSLLDVLIIVGLSFCTVGALVAVFIQLRDFLSALRSINMEIRRTDGREQAHWRKKRRRLWLSLLPFIRK